MAAEQSIIGVKASVMVYDDTNKKWMASGPGGGQPSLSKVHIYQHPAKNTFRVVGRRIQDQEVVINCIIPKTLRYNEATPTFHQWRDQRQGYGLNFTSKDDADAFSKSMTAAVQALQGPPPAVESATHPIAQTTPPDTADGVPESSSEPVQASSTVQQNNLPTGQQNNLVTEQQNNLVTGQQNNLAAGQVTLQPQSNITSQAAPAQPPVAPAAPSPPVAAPPVAPAPPAATSGIPPPPPPPPPPGPMSGPPAPSGPTAANSGGLAALLANKKNKLASGPKPEERANAGGGGGDLMSEMMAKMAKRKKQAEGGDSGTLPSSSVAPMEPMPRSNGTPSAKTNKYATLPTDSPKFPKKGWTENRSGSASSSGGAAGLSQSQLDSLRENILRDVREQMQQLKIEIIAAVREELRH